MDLCTLLLTMGARLILSPCRPLTVFETLEKSSQKLSELMLLILYPHLILCFPQLEHVFI